MKSLIGLLVVALIGAAIYWMALTKTQSTTVPPHPRGPFPRPA